MAMEQDKNLVTPVYECPKFVPVIRIFDMDGGCTWYAAETKEQAIAAYENDGCETEDPVDVVEIPEASYDRMMFSEDPGAEDDVQRTFREELNRRVTSGEKFPQFFATSEF